MCVHTCKHAPVSDRTESREVTGRCQSLLCVIVTTHHPPSPETACPQGWYPQRNRSGASCWGNHDKMGVKHLFLAYHTAVCVPFTMSSSVSACYIFSDWSLDFISLEEYNNVAEICHNIQVIPLLCNLWQLLHRIQCRPRLLRPEISLLLCPVSLWGRIHTVQCRNVSQKQVFCSWTGFGIQLELGHSVHPNSGISGAGEQRHRLLLSLAGSGPAEHCW